MLNWSQRKLFARILLVIMCIPVCLAGTCPGPVPPPPPPPPPPGDTILLNTTVSATAGACGLAPACAAATAVFFDTFSPVAAGKLITATVTGATTTSRPRIQISTLLGAVVADSGATPTTNTTTTTFTPTSTGLHFIRVCNCGGAPAPTYTISISQAP